MDELNIINAPAYYNCNPDECGKPLCKLPTLTNPTYNNRIVKTPQIFGCSLEELSTAKRDISKHRAYNTFVITDFPDREADRQGFPIWGDARKVLIEVLGKAQFNPERTYITSHAKCMPPKRKPSSKEYSKCRIHLQYELYKYKPQLIILLGSDCLKIFNLHGKGGITSIHGEVYQDMLYPDWDFPEENYTVMPTFHPKQFLASKDMKVLWMIQEDFNKARSCLNDGVVVNNDYYKAKFQVVETIEELDKAIAIIEQEKLFAFDTESPNLDFMRSPAIMVQLSCGEGKTWVIPFYRHDPEGKLFGKFKLKPVWHNGHRAELNERLKSIFENETIAKAAHNIRYDMNVLRRWCGIETKGWLWDTQVMHHLLETNPPHGLKELADKEFHVGNWERDIDAIVGHGKKKVKDYDEIPDDTFHQYGATDAELTHHLFCAYYDDMKNKANLMKLYEEESIPVLATLAEAEYTGVHLNVENVKALGAKFDQEMENLLILLRQESKPDFNPSSPDQVAAALRSKGFASVIEDKNAASGYSVDKDTLLDIGTIFTTNIVTYRNRKKFKSTYVDNALNSLGEDGRIRHSFNPTGTISGRLSCPFLHQIPRSKEDDIKAGNLVMRDMFDEEDDFVLYNADYSQIELWVFAHITQEQELMDTLADPNGDIHRLTASVALGCSPDMVTKELRSNIGKPLNFGTIYGSEGHALARIEYKCPFTNKIVKVGKERALEFVRNFRLKYEKVNMFLRDVPDKARFRGNRVLTIFGREILIPDLNNIDEYKKSRAERTATNAAVQSPAAAITLRTMTMVRELIHYYDLKDKIRLINTVHDSLTYGVHKDYIEWFDSAFRQIATRPIPELNNVQLPVETGWGKTWAEAENNAA